MTALRDSGRAGMQPAGFGLNLAVSGIAHSFPLRMSTGVSFRRSGLESVGSITPVLSQSRPRLRLLLWPYQTNGHIVESSAPPAGVGEPGVPPGPRESA